MSDRPPLVSVIVPVRDAASDLRALVGALAAQREAPSFELVVADDGSRTPVGPELADAPFPVRTVRRATSGGPGRARNAAVEVARGELLAFTDADCRPEPGWLAALTTALRLGGVVVQGPIRVPDGVLVGPFDRALQRTAANALHETANLGVGRADVERVGGFPSGPTPLRGKEMGEDVGLGCRLLRAGLRSTWCPDAVVVHPVQRRGWRAAAAERCRSGGFPELVAAWPELRRDLLHRRWFLGPSRPVTDLAAAGAVLVAAAGVLPSRARRPARVVGALASLPYLRRLRGRAAGRPAAAAGLVAGDVAETVALAAGSVRARTPVL